MELKFIKYEKRGHLAYITLNRPEVMNALHPPCHLEMDQVWDDFAGDREMWVAILTGSKVAWRILGRADAGTRPMAAHASHARISMRSHSSSRCRSDHTARIAGGEYRSIK